ncbi:hypothetical protein L3081_07840 [Colwellia sp. MSW7]|uniref:Uncharacterized protein n=1 Tax=Colwellia maritima TaxID=2912588 RepID=A0ABS9WZA3_9GAMM|nr:hypothetical protein [Colwellia maritima]MCI2283327.1 hypothetical protein [Colwellia maritima]
MAVSKTKSGSRRFLPSGPPHHPACGSAQGGSLTMMDFDPDIPKPALAKYSLLNAHVKRTKALLKVMLLEIITNKRLTITLKKTYI